MESINKIEIQGVVGSVRLNTIFDEQVANFSVATTMMYKNKQGDVIAETTWHNVVVCGSKTSADLTKIEKGSNVHVIGRLRQTKYTDINGTEKLFYEIIANDFQFVEE